MKKDDYLWNGSGEPDPEVQKLETVLRRYRHNQPAPKIDEVVEIRPVKRRWSFFNLRWSYQLAVVATVLLGAVAVLLVVRQKADRNLRPSGWVARLRGAPLP